MRQRTLGTPTIPTTLTLDEMLSRTAARTPDRAAIRTTLDDVSFGELDARVSRLAAAIVDLVGERPCRIAVTPTLCTSFPVSLYGVLRSGNVAVTVKPMLRTAGIESVLRGCDVRLAFLTQALYARIAPAADRLPGLRFVIVDEGAPAHEPGVLVLDDLLAAADPAPPRRRADPASVAYLHFTHGTTGEPRAVQLSHRNLVANAVQTANAHELERLGIVLNHLPIYHCMHLNGAISAGATQVLCPDPNPATAIAMANAYGARCFYAQPGQLARLAIDQRLPDLRFETVEVVRTGGTDLKPSTASALSAHFGVPVIQGYGMVENAALTHSDKRERPKLGSVGPAVLQTQCRVVDIDTRVPVPAGRRGEVQVRGPQVAVGYLGSDEPLVDADGWLSTGDVGYQDEDGYLRLVDRLGDLFKVGNELVSPTEIERLLTTHPAVRDCAVVDYPDPILGRVPYALVVPRDRSAATPLAEIAAFANRQLPPHQRIRHITTIATIPGADFGKVQRRQLREQLIDPAAGTPGAVARTEGRQP
ncbi:class I adenylate-forming enzyme family protein [Dactylosporangium sp. CA-092794]|uniref:class I adenylate-forming enzyme family protein n=1 Tax=Dactylosporangium sp. CA-092794 TaxID=3239929 RepID=UPI003D8E6792